MQLPSGLPPCKVKIPDGPHHALSTSQSLTIVKAMVEFLHSLWWTVTFSIVPLLFLLFLVFYQFDNDRPLIGSNLSPVLIFFVIIEIGTSILFRWGRSRLISGCLRMIQRLMQIASKDIRINLTSGKLILNADNIREPLDIEQTYQWKQVESITEDETGFRIQLPGLPELLLPKEQLPAEWQVALQTNDTERAMDEVSGESQ